MTRLATPGRRTVGLWTAVVAAEVALVVLHLRTGGMCSLAPRYLAYPFVWLNVALLAVVRVAPIAPGARRRRRLAAGLLAAGYFLAVAWIAGVVGPAAHGSTLRVLPLPPGWGPALLYDGALVRLRLFPYEVAGYAALAYLVYATLVEAAETALGGLVGLGSCVSCTLPVAATLLSGVAGGSAALAGADAYSLDLSTLVFVVTVGVLLWGVER